MTARRGNSVNGKAPGNGALTPMQARFVDEYLVDLNGKQAAIRAGYSAKTAAAQAARLLTKVNVADAVATAKAKRQERVEITQDEVIREVRAMAFSDHTNYRVDDSGAVTLAPGAPANAHRAVSSIKHRITSNGEGTVTREVEIKLWDKPSMVKLAGRHRAVPGFFDRMEVTGKDGGPMEVRSVKDLSSGERRKRIAELTSKRAIVGS